MTVMSAASYFVAASAFLLLMPATISATSAATLAAIGDGFAA